MSCGTINIQIVEPCDINNITVQEMEDSINLTIVECFDSGDGGTGPIGPQGNDGRDAYQVAVEDGGFVGTRIEWLATLEGNQGIQGIQGETGASGTNGADGIDGTNGLQGAQGVQGIQGIQGAQGITTDVIAIYMSTATEDLTAGDKASVGAPYDFTLNSFWLWVETAPTTQSLVADLKKAGVSVSTTNAAIDANETTSLTGTAPVLTGDLTFFKGSKITPVLIQAGGVETGKNLIMYLEVTKI